MKKLVFVMMAALSLMFVSCNTTPTSTKTSSEGSGVYIEPEVTESIATPVGPAVEKPSKPEVKEDVDVTTPAKPTTEANKPIGNKK